MFKLMLQGASARAREKKSEKERKRESRGGGDARQESLVERLMTNYKAEAAMDGQSDTGGGEGKGSEVAARPPPTWPPQHRRAPRVTLPFGLVSHQVAASSQ